MLLNRSFLALVAANIILGAPMPMLIILGGLAGAQLAPFDWMITVPMSTLLLTGIVSATPMSLLMGRRGRKVGFLLGALVLTAGGATGAQAVATGSFWLLCTAHGMLGISLTSFKYFRFAAAETVSNHRKAQAISYLLGSGLVAALMAPVIFSGTQDFLAPIPLAGAYLAISGLGLTGMIPLFLFKSPRPAGASKNEPERKPRQKIDTRVAVYIGLGALSQSFMVLLMAPTPAAVTGCGFSNGIAASVIGWHVFAMYAPSFFTSSVILKAGGERTAAAGIALMALSASIGAMGTTAIHFYLCLILLGIGWNFSYVAATFLLESVLNDRNRAVLQGLNDTIIASSAFASSLLSGLSYAEIGWETHNALSMLGLTVLGLTFAGTVVWQRYPPGAGKH